MRFTVRSLGGKLILVALLTLLLCLLFSIILSWSLLKLYAENEARSDAQLQLSLFKQSYQVYTTTLVDDMHALDDANVPTNLPHQAALDRLHNLLVTIAIRHHLSRLDFITAKHQVLVQIENTATTKYAVEPTVATLVDQAIQGKPAMTFAPIQSTDHTSLAPGQQWSLNVAVPLQHFAHLQGTLVAAHPIDDDFSQILMQKSGKSIALCLDSHIQGTAGIPALNPDNRRIITNQVLCHPNSLTIINASQSYLIATSTILSRPHTTNTSALLIAVIEPIYTLNIHESRQILMLAGIGIFTFALGVVIYAFFVRTFFVLPLRRLQAHVQAITPSDSEQALTRYTGDEFETLINTFNQLSASLDSESQALTDQMRNLLIMSDMLISTLNLEQLLGEFISRMGQIMQVKHVSLLLYEQEKQIPWAAAQWTEQTVTEVTSSATTVTTHPLHAQKGNVSVHIASKGDIAKTTTSKVAAVSPTSFFKTTGPKKALRATKMRKEIVSAEEQALARPARLPVRDLDIMLARMVLQRKKIACGEDIEKIHQERGEKWARLALEDHYHSAIAVPLLLQDRVLGAFMLYAERPHQMTNRDTFLLSTAAIQAAMAIQNALLFAEVKDKNAALERANQLKSQFLANVTHELRTPLHSIISYGGLLLEGFVDGELTSEQDEHIQFMVRRAEDLSQLVDDMLDLSKIEADRIEVKLEALALEPCLNEVVNQLKPLANNKGLHLQIEMAPDLPNALADSHRVRQVLINLVSNAIKFTEQGGVTIQCIHLIEHNMLRIAVEDSGIGISPAAMEYIFEAFRQADGSTTRRFGGTGLGLTIAKKLIELQGGEITVESVLGQSATFAFTLPIASGQVAS